MSPQGLHKVSKKFPQGLHKVFTRAPQGLHKVPNILEKSPADGKNNQVSREKPASNFVYFFPLTRFSPLHIQRVNQTFSESSLHLRAYL